MFNTNEIKSNFKEIKVTKDTVLEFSCLFEMFKMFPFIFHTILNYTSNTFTNFLIYFNGNFMKFD